MVRWISFGLGIQMWLKMVLVSPFGSHISLVMCRYISGYTLTHYAKVSSKLHSVSSIRLGRNRHLTKEEWKGVDFGRQRGLSISLTFKFPFDWRICLELLFNVWCGRGGKRRNHQMKVIQRSRSRRHNPYNRDKIQNKHKTGNHPLHIETTWSSSKVYQGRVVSFHIRLYFSTRGNIWLENSQCKVFTKGNTHSRRSFPLSFLPHHCCHHFWDIHYIGICWVAVNPFTPRQLKAS